MLPPMDSAFWGRLFWLVVGVCAAISSVRTPGPNRLARSLFYLDMAIAAAVMFAERTSFRLPFLFVNIGWVCSAAAMWFANPDHWLAPQTVHGDRRLVRYVGWCVLLLGVVLAATVAILVSPTFVQRSIPEGQDWIETAAIALSVGGIIRLGYRMAHVPLDPVNAAFGGEPPTA